MIVNNIYLFKCRNSRKVTIKILVSACVSDYPIPSLQNLKRKSTEVFIPNDVLQFAQPVVVKWRFNRSEIPTLYDVMIEEIVEEGVSIEDGCMRVWFAKLLPCFIIDTYAQ